MDLRKTGLISAFVALALGVAACGGGSPTEGARSSGTPAAGGRLKVSYRTEPKTFNRIVVAQPAEEMVARLTQATLIRLNRNTGELEPRLAKSWTPSPDGLTWTLKLVEGVTFSDGTPFTADDVLFSFQAIFDPRVKSEIASSLLIDGKPPMVRALDASTVVIVLPAPYGPGLSFLDAVPILPKHKLKAPLDAGTFRDAWSVTTPVTEVVGLGPFVIREYLPGQRLVFERNPKFWLKDAAGRTLPYLDAVEVHFVADQNAEVLRLQAGDVDVISSQVRFEDLASLKDLEKKGQLTLHDAGMSIAPDILWFNLVPGAKSAQGRPWLQQDALRLAISSAVDRKAMVNTVFLGEATEIRGPITPGHQTWFVPEISRPTLDVEAAKKQLASIDLVDRNKDGFVDDRAGRTARFSMLTQKGHSVRERSAAVIQEQLKRVGLQVDVVPLEPRSMIDAWSKGEYDAIYFGISFDSLDPARHMDFWLSGGAFHFWHPRQAKPATTWEGEIDRLMKKQAMTMDPAERKRLFADAQRVLAAHEPALYFAAPKVVLATSARVRGLTPSVLAPELLWNAERMYVVK
jgi:peptide/nickel transport system substrate-binding protein